MQDQPPPGNVKSEIIKGPPPPANPNAAKEMATKELEYRQRQLEKAEAGAKPEHITRMTWYLTDRREYLARSMEIGAAFRELVGCYHAAMSAVEVRALMAEGAKVEIEVTAVIPGV